MREEDLEHHMPNEDVKEKESEEKKNGQEEAEEERANELIEGDNQVRHALELLQTWDVFSQLKPHPVE